jgi:hypothetical protein
MHAICMLHRKFYELVTRCHKILMNSESYISELAISTWVLRLQSLHIYSATLFNPCEDLVWQSSAFEYLIFRSWNLTKLQHLAFFRTTKQYNNWSSLYADGRMAIFFLSLEVLSYRRLSHWLTNGNCLYSKSPWNNFSAVISYFVFCFKFL